MYRNPNLLEIKLHPGVKSLKKNKRSLSYFHQLYRQQRTAAVSGKKAYFGRYDEYFGALKLSKNCSKHSYNLLLMSNLIEFNPESFKQSNFHKCNKQNRQISAKPEIRKIADFDQNYAHFGAPKTALFVINIQTRFFCCVFQCIKTLKSMENIILLMLTLRYKHV